MRFSSALEVPVRWPRAALAVAFAVSVALFAGVERLEVDSGIESMMVQGDADHAAFEDKKRIFGSDEIVSIALPYEDALSAGALAEQQRIAARLEAIPEIAEVDALATTDDIFGHEESLEVERLVPADAAALSPQQLAAIRARVDERPIWTGFLISRDRKTAALQVRFANDVHHSHERSALMARIEAAVAAERDGGEVHIAGHPFMKTEIARTMQRDLGRFLPATLLAMTLLVIVALGSLRLAAVLLGSALLTVAWTLGAMGWLGQPITALSNTAPTILFAIATAYLMHLVASYGRALAGGGTRQEVVIRALAEVRGPIVLAGLTTAAGFGFVAISRIPLVRDFGLDLCVGIALLLAVSCVVTPALLCLLPATPVQGLLGDGPRLRPVFGGLYRFAARFARPIVAASVVLVAVAAGLATQLVVDSSGPNAFAEDSRFRRSAAFYREQFSGDVIENVYLRGEPGAFTDPERLRRLQAFQADAEALDAVDNTLSIADYVALMNRAIHGDDPRQEVIPESAAAVAQFLLLYESSGDPTEFDDLIDPHRAETRIVLNATVLSSRESALLRGRLEALARKHFPDESDASSVLSTEILLSKAADALAVEQVRSLVGAWLLILLGVGLAFRSLRAALLLGLPNGLPVVLGFAAMAVCGITLRDVTSVIAVTTLGLAVDSTVHLLHSVRRREARVGRCEAVAATLRTTGRPVLVTGAAVVVGFAVLGLSGFRVVSDFGVLTAFAIACALAADLVLLPAQLLAGRGVVSSPLGAERGAVSSAEGGGLASGARVLDVGRVLAPAVVPSPKEIVFDGFRVGYATELGEQIEAYRFRYNVFVEHGYIDAQSGADPMLRDPHDEAGVQIVARDGEGGLVGAARIVLPSVLGLQTSQLFNVLAYPTEADRLGEVGRLAIDGDRRGGSRGPLLGMIQLIHRGLRANGLTHALAFMPGGLIASLNAIGCVSHDLETGPATPAIHRHREVMRGYFDEQTPRAVFFDLLEIEAAVESWGRRC